MLAAKKNLLVKEIAIVLCLKIFALAFMKYCFFSNPTARNIKNNDSAVSTHILDHQSFLNKTNIKKGYS
jgi:hypothetical protein